MATIRFIGVATALLVGACATAQSFSVEVSPNPTPQGGTIQIKSSCNVTAGLSNGCGFSAIHRGTPTGPIVYAPRICPAIAIGVGPGIVWTARWQAVVGSQPVAPGEYFVEVGWRTNSMPSVMRRHFAPFRIDPPAGPSGPALTTVTGAQRGRVLDLVLTSPADPGASYIAAASLATNTGQTLSPTQHLALDADALFFLSFPIPNGALFNRFQGTLDPQGAAKPQMFIPPVRSLQGAQVAFQAAVLRSSGVVLSNGITRGIQ